MKGALGRLAVCIGGFLALGCLGGASPPEILTLDCQYQRGDWTPGELSAIAFRVGGYPPHGRRGDRVSIGTEGCAFVVFINLRELEPGSHDSVRISAIDGTVSDVVGGE